MININNMVSYLKNEISNHKVLVVGDIMLDRYFYGEVSRISPEAPVPITLIKKKKDTLGGAANVAHNLSKMGVKVFLVGAICDDHHGRLLMKKLNELKINTDGICPFRNKTTTKTRILGGHQQMIRIDFEETSDFEPQNINEIFHRVKKIIKVNNIDAIILSDYGKGVCSNTICQEIIKMNIPCFVDPKGSNWNKYYGATCITPNIKETSDVFGSKVENDTEDIRKVGRLLIDQYHLQYIMITRSEKGLSIFSKKHEITIPTVAHEVYDVSGAGDTVIASFVAGYIGGLPVDDVAFMANVSAGIGVGKLGTYAVSRKEIIAELVKKGKNED